MCQAAVQVDVLQARQGKRQEREALGSRCGWQSDECVHDWHPVCVRPLILGSLYDDDALVGRSLHPH